jgi:hypothetical protein
MPKSSVLFLVSLRCGEVEKCVRLLILTARILTRVGVRWPGRSAAEPLQAGMLEWYGIILALAIDQTGCMEERYQRWCISMRSY